MEREAGRNSPSKLGLAQGPCKLTSVVLPNGEKLSVVLPLRLSWKLAALIIYYSLLLSLSEHLGYNFAYGIATAATVVLVALYSSTFFSSRKLVFIFTGLITFFYGFIFVIIQLQDYSLLLGSIGLFLIVGLIMYFSKNIKWYQEESAVQA